MTVERGLTPTRLAHRRSRALEILFPSTYRIIPPDRTEVLPSGSVDEIDADPLLYNGIPDIPCRVDESKRYQDTNVFGQEAVFSAYEIFVPYDAPLYPDTTIVIDGQNDHLFEIKRLVTRVSNSVTKSAMIVAIESGIPA